MRLAGQRLEREQAAFAGFAPRSGRALGAFLGERIPLAAGLAFTLPAGRRRPTVLADEGQIAPGHEGIAAKSIVCMLIQP